MTSREGTSNLSSKSSVKIAQTISRVGGQKQSDELQDHDDVAQFDKISKPIRSEETWTDVQLEGKQCQNGISGRYFCNGIGILGDCGTGLDRSS